MAVGLVDRDDGWRIPDETWARMEPLLPPRPRHRLGCHNPRVPDRNAMNAVLLVLRTGMQWKALNATGICSSSSAHRRFQEWARAGVFEQFWRQGLLAYDESQGIEWGWLSCDGLMGKAPLGGEATGPNPTDRAKKGEALPSLRRQGSPARARNRRRERQRLPAASLDAREHRGRPAGRQPG
jgi:transposase